ncbi:MAG: hypothetical protein ACHQDB_01055 [Steroidobacterales bacterium]
MSLRAEYLDDSNGYLNGDFDASYHGRSQKLDEVTLTSGIDPTRNFEFRIGGRYDDPSTVAGARVVPSTYPSWFVAIYRF